MPTENDDPLAAYSRALDGARRLPAAQQRLRAAAETRLTSEVTLDELYRQLERMTGWNPATWWPRLTGRIRERQTALTDAIVRQDSLLKRTVRDHESALMEVQSAQASVDALPAAREAAAAALEGATGEQARQLVDEARRLHRAIAAAGRVQMMASGARKELATANRWSLHDVYLDGGIASSAMKHEYIESANNTAVDITAELALLRAELQHMNVPTGYFTVQTNDLVASMDMYYDNVLSDIAMSRRIKASRGRLERLDAGLTEIAAVLGERHKQTVEQIDVLLATR